MDLLEYVLANYTYIPQEIGEHKSFSAAC
jgi:hypothetical protein